MHRVTRLFTAVFVALVIAALAPEPSLGAQQPRGGPMPSAQWEARADMSFTPALAAHVGAGLNVRAGHYARLGVSYLAGTAQGPAGDRDARFSQRAEATARFLLDPFAERAHGLYGGAGFTARRDGGEAWKAGLMLVVGLEGFPRGSMIPAVEVALGGGVRAGVVLRARRRGAFPTR
ncbi:MAG: hypothetical protein ACYC0B_07135 [Gemmatimonadaceae bacterium]